MRFNLGAISDAENRFRRDFVEFSRLWQSAKDDWKDERCRRFEQEHLSTLGPSLNRLVASVNQLTELVRKADRALADDRESETELY